MEDLFLLNTLEGAICFRTAFGTCDEETIFWIIDFRTGIVGMYVLKLNDEYFQLMFQEMKIFESAELKLVKNWQSVKFSLKIYSGYFSTPRYNLVHKSGIAREIDYLGREVLMQL